MHYSLPISEHELLVIESLRTPGQDESWPDESVVQSLGLDGSGEELFKVASRMNLVHTVGNRLRRQQDTGMFEVGRLVKSRFDTYQRVADLATTVQQRAWTEIAQALAAAGVECLALKGVHLQAKYYPSTCRYLANDVDVLVRPESLHKSREVLAECGYTQGIKRIGSRYAPVEQAAIQNFERDHYELFPYTKIIAVQWPDGIGKEDLARLKISHPTYVEGENLYIAVEIDVHHNLAPGIDLEDIWREPDEFVVEDSVYRAVSPSVLMWFLPARFYHEVMITADRSAKTLADLAFVIAGSTVDFTPALHCAEKYALEPGLFYVYSFLDSLAAIENGATLLASLNDLLKRDRRLHDWGDFVPKLLGRRVTFRVALDSGQATHPQATHAS